MQNDRDDDIYFRKTSIFETTIIALILFFSISSILWISYSGRRQSSEAPLAVILVENELFEEVDLRQDRRITLPVGDMQIEVKERAIRVARSNCPKQICVNAGWIKTPGQTIICVPYKVLIQIKGTGLPPLDAVVH